MEVDHEPATDYVWKGTKENPNSLRTTACSVDTVFYTAAKTSTQKIKILVSNGTYASSYGQWYELGQDMNINGVVWYGYSHDPSGLTNPSITVTCSVYDSDPSGLPTGSALTSATITVDTNSANARREVLFASPLTVSSNYIMVLSHSQPDYLYVLSNDENAADGAGEDLSCAYYDPGGGWFKNLTLWGLGDFDLLIHPIVDYELDAHYTSSGTGTDVCVGELINFNNTSSWVMKSKFYNSAVQAGGPASFHWDYGDGTFQNYVEHGTHTYGVAGAYNVVLDDTIFGWTMQCDDQQLGVFNVYDVPAAPAASSPAMVCEYTPAPPLTATGGTGTITWYSDAGLTSMIGTGSPFNSGITGPAPSVTVYVTEIENGCESPATAVVIPFDSNPIPTFTVTNTGGLSFDFTGAPAASSYSWDFGDGTGTSTAPAPSYTYTAGGSYTVCLDVVYSNGCTNQYCDVAAVLSTAEFDRNNLVLVYPNPANDGFFVDSKDINENGDLVMYDMVGNIVHAENVNNGQRTFVETEHLAAGTYFLTINYVNEGMISKKLVISR